MKTKILPAIITAIIFSSCSSAYKTSQTPDDLYYSPAKEVTVSNESETRKEKKKREEVIREEDYTSLDDRYIRMKVANRRWSSLDDYAYWNDIRYSNSCNCTCTSTNFVLFEGRYYPVRSYGYTTFNNPFNPYGVRYYSWNNPYYYPITYVKTVPSEPNARPSRALVETYKNNTYDNTNRPSFEKGRTIYSSEPNQSNQGLLKRVFSSSNGTQTERSVRTFESNNSNNSNSSNSTTTNSNSSGRSNGYNSTGTSTSTSRPPRKQ